MCSLSQLCTVGLKVIIRGCVCVWFSSISLVKQVMTMELHLWLALPVVTETRVINNVGTYAYQNNHTKACTS
jgi:predicted phosphohydrolase